MTDDDESTASGLCTLCGWVGHIETDFDRRPAEAFASVAAFGMHFMTMHPGVETGDVNSHILVSK